MTEEIRDSLIDNLSSAMDTQSRIALALDTEWNIWKTVYNKQDLLNASLIFTHVLWNISAGYCLNELWFDMNQASMIAEESWQNIRQTILLATGIDTHTIFNKE